MRIETAQHTAGTARRTRASAAPDRHKPTRISRNQPRLPQNASLVV